jgi:hypothetical protein
VLSVTLVPLRYHRPLPMYHPHGVKSAQDILFGSQNLPDQRFTQVLRDVRPWPPVCRWL